jgi:hypothetical protein
MYSYMALIALLWAFLATGVAQATYYPSLDSLASYWAQRPIQVDCPEDWADDPWAVGTWGYTFLGSAEVRVDPQLCDAAMSLVDGGPGDEDWRSALSVLVITHEAFHLRDWKWNGNEGRVECMAIRSWPESFLILSHWNLPAFRQAMPYALAEHYQIAATFPEYNFKGCHIGWWPPW